VGVEPPVLQLGEPVREREADAQAAL